jgi:hypothetical protein
MVRPSVDEVSTMHASTNVTALIGRMNPLTRSIGCVFAMGITGCGNSFGVAAPDNDAGRDASEIDDGGMSDVSPTDDSSSDASLDANPQVDVNVEPRLDAAVIDVARDAADDVVRDAPRSDSSVGDAGSRDGVADGLFADVGRIDAPLVDAPVGDGSGADVRCVPETDREFCVRLGKSCEMVAATDNCAVLRNVNCGACAVGLGCVDGVCKTPVCSNFSYSSAVYPPFSVAGRSDFAIATSAQGESILYAQSPVADCSTAITYIADEVTPGSRTYTSRSIAPWLDSYGVTGQALSGDGLALITLGNDFRTFQSARRSALHVIDFGAPAAADFTAINMPAGSAGLFRGGVISTDGLEFYYTIFGGDAATDGMYRAKRLASSSPFSVGARLNGIDPSYTDVTAISSDRLTLFVFKTWAGFVFTRSSTSAEFSNPNAPNPPPELPGFHHKPFADCATMVSTMTIGGGCANQDIFFQTRR